MRILVTRRLPDGGLAPLDGHELVGPKPDDAPYTHDELVAHAAEVDAIVALLTDRIDAEVLDAGARGGRLRVVANVAVGYDNIDVGAATAHGITVCNTPGVLDETTADLAFLLILAAARLASEAEHDLRTGAWSGSGGASTSTSARTCTTPRSASSASGASAGPSRPAPAASACTSSITRARRPASPASSPTSTRCSRRPTSSACTCPAAPRRTT